MGQRTDITISLFDTDGVRLMGSTKRPRKCVIKSGFGAGKRRCWIEFFNEDMHLPVVIGEILEISMNGNLCFRGRIQERRIDSVDDHLSCYAEFDPEQEYNQQVFGTFENQNVREILLQILYGSGLSLTGTFDENLRFKRLTFSGESLFPAVDLLAKLAGNYLWDIHNRDILELRPIRLQEDHRVVLRRDVDTVNLWQTTNDLYSTIKIMGGIKDGSSYDKTIEIPELEGVAGSSTIRVYVRPVTELDSYIALRRAVVQQMLAPRYEHYVDWLENGERIEPGQTVRFHGEYLSLFPQNVVFRVKMREITYAHENLQIRFHITSGYESSESYFHYFHVDYPIPRSGAFQLDVSALDSLAPLDAVPV